MNTLDEKVYRIGGPAEKRGVPVDKARAFDKVNPKTGARPNRSMLKKLEMSRRPEFFALDVSEDPDYTMVLVLRSGVDDPEYYGVNVLFYPDGLMNQAVEILKASGINEAKKIKEPGWYVCDHMDKPVSGPMQERGAKEEAEEMNAKHAEKHGKGDITPYSAEYFTDYEIKRMNNGAQNAP